MHFTTGEEGIKGGGRAVAESGCNCGSLLNDSGKKFYMAQGRGHAAYA